MHLAAYHFAGDPDALKAGYDRLTATFPPGEIELNVCVLTAEGITVLDACPTQADFEAFSTGPQFAEALAAAGLPAPRVEAMGSVAAFAGTAFAATTNA